MLIFLRHGRTPNNAQARLQGQEDAPLDDVGFAQAAAAGDYIRERWNIDRVVRSSLTRTAQTADTAGFGELDTRVDDRWAEIEFGTYDNRQIAEVVSELGASWARDIEFAPPDGESMGALHRRVGAALDELRANHVPGQNVLVVSHATPIKSAVVWAMDGPAEMILRLRISLASITLVEHGPAGPLLSEFNLRPLPHLA